MEERLRNKILSLSLQWQFLRDQAELSEYYGHDASERRREMAKLQAQIRRLKDEMERTEESA